MMFPHIRRPLDLDRVFSPPVAVPHATPIPRGRPLDKSVLAAFEDTGAIAEALSKGGEGSRGGKILGHTKTGKPIYAGGLNNEHALVARDTRMMEVAQRPYSSTWGKGKGLAKGFGMMGDGDAPQDAAAFEQVEQIVNQHQAQTGEAPHVAPGGCPNCGFGAVQPTAPACAACGTPMEKCGGMNKSEDNITPGKVAATIAGGVAAPVVHGAYSTAVGYMSRSMEDTNMGHPLQKSLVEALSKGGYKGYKLKGMRGAHGPGSRGGHVIGHTRSGKPVYASTSADHPDYRHFTVADHADAAVLHEGHHRASGENSTSNYVNGVLGRHRTNHVSDSHQDAAVSEIEKHELSGDDRKIYAQVDKHLDDAMSHYASHPGVAHLKKHGW